MNTNSRRTCLTFSEKEKVIIIVLYQLYATQRLYTRKQVHWAIRTLRFEARITEEDAVYLLRELRFFVLPAGENYDPVFSEGLGVYRIIFDSSPEEVEDSEVSDFDTLPDGATFVM